MKKLIVGLIGPLLLCACATQRPAPVQWDPQVVRGTLPNGLQYRLVRDTRQAGRLDIRLTVKAGSVDEEADQVGVAHLLEHLAFYSHGAQPQDVRARLHAAGWVQGRNYNAMTAYDRTQYLMSPPRGASDADNALQSLAMLVFAGDYSAQDLDHERAVVIEEWRGGLGVAQRMNDARTASQRSGSRYPQHRTIGNEQAIRAASIDALKAYQQRWYQPGNMIVSVVGDFQPRQMAAAIERWFGPHPGSPVSQRRAHDLPLDQQLKIFQLQDSQSGINQVSLLFRFHEQSSRAPTLAGLRERMIDRFTLAALLAQLQRQAKGPGVRSLTAQKTQIGEYSSVLGVAAGVEGEEHRAALRQLLEEIARLQQHGLAQADLDKQKDSLRLKIDDTLAKPETRTFEQWVNALNDAAVLGRNVQGSHAKAQANLHWLDGITLAEVNLRLRYWLSRPDQVLQMGAPGLSPLQLPSVAQVEKLRAQVSGAALPPPLAVAAPAVLTPLPEPPAPPAPGAIISRQLFARENVEHWQLGNGDRLVWLRRNGEQGRLVLEAESSAGYMTAGLPAWRLQMAAQLAARSGPAGWTAAQVQAWRNQQHVSFSVDQQPDRLRVSLANRDAGAGLHNLLQTYRLAQHAVSIERSAFASALADLASREQRSAGSVQVARDSAARRLRHGTDTWQSPSAEQLAALGASDLDRDWQALVRAPVTYYLMADVPANELEQQVLAQLANIPRSAALQTNNLAQAPGRRVAQLAVAIEPRANLQANSYTAHAWDPVQAASVSALGALARSRLQTALRQQAAGVYRLAFDSQLNQSTQRIESQLSFTSDPARVDELWGLALETLAQLPAQLDTATVAGLSAQLHRQETKRQADSATQLHRLILSEREWGDPRYLSQQKQLLLPLQPAALKVLAGKLFNEHNLAVLQVMPAPAAR